MTADDIHIIEDFQAWAIQEIKRSRARQDRLMWMAPLLGFAMTMALVLLYSFGAGP